MKKLFFFLVSLLINVGVWAFEVDGIYYGVISEEDKTVYVYSYLSSFEGDLALNGTVTYNQTEYKLVSISNYVFRDCSKTITIGNLPYCTYIGEESFQNCRTLTSVGDLSACTSIGNNAFQYCSSLASVGNLSACTSIGNDAFNGCSSLASVGNLSACTSIGNYAFKNCSSLASVGDLSACTSIGNNAFDYCRSLASVGDLSACTSIGGSAFINCNSLASVDLSACTSIGTSAFRWCSSLASVGDLSVCTSIGDYAFYGCNRLASVSDLSACTSIGSYAFQYCGSLASVGDLSACTSIGNSAFSGCSSLASVGDLSACTSIGTTAFNGIEKVRISNNTPPTLTGAPTDAGTTFLVPAAALETYRAADYWADIKFQIIADNAVTEYDVNAPILDGVGASNLTNVMTLKVTGDIDSEDIMFIRNNMVNLHHLDLTDANYKASDDEYASGKHTSANSVGGLYELKRLRSVKLPRSAKTIEKDALRNCSYLYDITIPEGIERIEDGIVNNYNIANCTGAFTGCNFSSLVLPNSLTYIGDGTFTNSGLISLNLPEELIEIGRGTFGNCQSLSSVIFSPKLKKIGSGAFESCGNLSSVNLPTSLTSIGSQTFQYNTALTVLRIPSSVESIGSQAFASCSNLKDVYVYVVDPINMNTNTFSTYAAATLHIPEQCENTYFRNPQWGQFLNMTTFNEPYTYFYATNDVVLQENERFDAEQGEDIDFNGNSGSSITIEGSTIQPLGYMDLYFDGSKWASVIADENLTATHVRFHIPVTGNRWKFFSFPFRVYLNKVTAPGSHVFRCYDGAQRAGNGGTGWKSLPDGTTYLEPGVGYIFQCNQTGELLIEVDNPDFYWHGNNMTNALTAYAP